MNVRIQNEGKPGYATQITNAETGEVIPHVLRAEIDLDAREAVPQAVLYVALPKIDVRADAEIKQVCPYCGRPKDDRQKIRDTAQKALDTTPHYPGVLSAALEDIIELCKGE